MLDYAQRPLFWFGHGIRLAGAVDLIWPFIERFNVPFVTSWQGKDMIDERQYNYFMGHAGVYGDRAANQAVQRADLIIAIGTRLSLMQTGFDLNKFAPYARIVVVDIDAEEAGKIGDRVVEDAGVWMRNFMASEPEYCAPISWLLQCRAWNYDMSERVTTLYDDTNGFLNPYQFCRELCKYLAEDQIITTDMGTALLCAYPAMTLNGKQRLITSTGLGEMGSGLPMAIGAYLATGRPIMCLNCDGGMMMNLQELATIQHLKIPIKLFVFDNGGYGMIRLSQDGLKMPRVASGLDAMTFPNWHVLSAAFGMRFEEVHNWSEFQGVMGRLQKIDLPVLVHVPTDPNFVFGPKVGYREALA